MSKLTNTHLGERHRFTARSDVGTIVLQAGANEDLFLNGFVAPYELNTVIAQSTSFENSNLYTSGYFGDVPSASDTYYIKIIDRNGYNIMNPNNGELEIYWGKAVKDTYLNPDQGELLYNYIVARGNNNQTLDFAGTSGEEGYRGFTFMFRKSIKHPSTIEYYNDAVSFSDVNLYLQTMFDSPELFSTTSDADRDGNNLVSASITSTTQRYYAPKYLDFASDTTTTPSTYNVNKPMITEFAMSKPSKYINITTVRGPLAVFNDTNGTMKISRVRVFGRNNGLDNQDITSLFTATGKQVGAVRGGTDNSSNVLSNMDTVGPSTFADLSTAVVTTTTPDKYIPFLQGIQLECSQPVIIQKIEIHAPMFDSGVAADTLLETYDYSYMVQCDDQFVGGRNNYHYYSNSDSSLHVIKVDMKERVKGFQAPFTGVFELTNFVSMTADASNDVSATPELWLMHEDNKGQLTKIKNLTFNETNRNLIQLQENDKVAFYWLGTKRSYSNSLYDYITLADSTFSVKCLDHALEEFQRFTDKKVEDRLIIADRCIQGGRINAMLEAITGFGSERGRDQYPIERIIDGELVLYTNPGNVLSEDLSQSEQVQATDVTSLTQPFEFCVGTYIGGDFYYVASRSVNQLYSSDGGLSWTDNNSAFSSAPLRVRTRPEGPRSGSNRIYFFSATEAFFIGSSGVTTITTSSFTATIQTDAIAIEDACYEPVSDRMVVLHTNSRTELYFEDDDGDFDKYYANEPTNNYVTLGHAHGKLFLFGTQLYAVTDDFGENYTEVAMDYTARGGTARSNGEVILFVTTSDEVIYYNDEIGQFKKVDATQYPNITASLTLEYFEGVFFLWGTGVAGYAAYSHDGLRWTEFPHFATASSTFGFCYGATKARSGETATIRNDTLLISLLSGEITIQEFGLQTSGLYRKTAAGFIREPGFELGDKADNLNIQVRKGPYAGLYTQTKRDKVFGEILDFVRVNEQNTKEFRQYGDTAINGYRNYYIKVDDTVYLEGNSSIPTVVSTTMAKPNIPMFSVKQTSDLGAVTGDGTAYTVLFGTKIFDNTTSYNTGTGIFVAPVAGKYYFSAQLYASIAATTHTSQTLALDYNNGDNLISQGTHPYNTRDSSARISVTVCGFFDLAVNDQIKVVYTVSSGAKTVTLVGRADSGTHFHGFYVG